MVYYEITGDEMTPPEDKAPDMPSEIWVNRNNPEPLLHGVTCWRTTTDKDISPINTVKYIRADTLPPQSPDQGAVDKLDLLQKRAYSHADKSNSPKLMREWIDSDVEVIRQALTRPPLDLAALRVGHTKDGSHEGWNACLDHLQAIRPDLFGGKNI